MVLPPRQFTGFSDIASHAARVIKSVWQFKDKLDKNQLETDMSGGREKGHPLCMAQYYRLFSCYRQPGVDRDCHRNIQSGNDSSQYHVILACQNQFYRLDVEWLGGSLSEQEIAGHVLYVLQSAADGAIPVGLLTSQRRDIWAENRQLLLQQEGNAQVLESIETSLMVLCLDLKPLFDSKFCAARTSSTGFTLPHRDESSMFHQMLHGGGSHLNTPNRWFDKTIQFILSIDGAWGLCYEHSPAEAVVVMSVVDAVMEASAPPPNRESIIATDEHLQPLEFIAPSNINRPINEAARAIDNLIEDVDFTVYRFEIFGKNYIKSCKMSPDAFVQLALQLAFFKLYGKLVTTYESASTRRYRLGRVDCIRSAHWETLQWVSAMSQSSGPDRRVTFSLVSDEEKLRLLDIAVAKQTEIMCETVKGHGLDIHLLGLREATKELGLPMDLFKDDSYQILQHFTLSTSQVASKHGFMGYGAVVPDGYGASYNILNDSIIFCLSAFHSAQHTSTTSFSSIISGLGVFGDGCVLSFICRAGGAGRCNFERLKRFNGFFLELTSWRLSRLPLQENC